MVKDRGSIKWTSLMLPEHVELLKQMWEENNKTQKPVIDPQMLEWLELELRDAYEYQNIITCYCYHNGYIDKIIGKIISFNITRHTVTFMTENGQNKTVVFNHIFSIC